MVVWIDGTIEIESPLTSSWVLHKTVNQSMQLMAFHHEMRQGKLSLEVLGTLASKNGKYVLEIHNAI